LLALNAGKHVLVEKPITLNHPDTLELVNLAREKGLFLMEAMWTRFFPAVRKARALIDAGEIGPVKVVIEASFSERGTLSLNLIPRQFSPILASC